MKSLGKLFQSDHQLKSLKRQSASHLHLIREVNRILPEEFRDHFIYCLTYGNKLRLLTSSSSWASRLRYFSREIQQQLSDKGLEFDKIEVKVALDTQIDEGIASAARRARLISTENAQTLREIAQGIEHPGLAASLQRLSRHMKESDLE